MKILLLQLDGKFPNLALMRIAAHHRERGDEVSLRIVGNKGGLIKTLWDNPDGVYASAIFDRSYELVKEVRSTYPQAIIGGNGFNKKVRVEQFGITTKRKDYSDYHGFTASIGFTQRGCRMSCSFCDVPQMEGKPFKDQLIEDIWRGEPNLRNLILWDNDTFGNPDWREAFAAIRDGGFRVSFNQGINARLLDEEAAEQLASLDCYATDFETRRWYTAWDNLPDEMTLFRGLKWLVKYGVRPDQIMVYMLCGYCHAHRGAASQCGCQQADSTQRREYRRRELREFGARPYPMPYERTPELVGFQRWVIGAYDKRIAWADWVRAKYRPENLTAKEEECPSTTQTA